MMLLRSVVSYPVEIERKLSPQPLEISMMKFYGGTELLAATVSDHAYAVTFEARMSE